MQLEYDFDSNQDDSDSQASDNSIILYDSQNELSPNEIQNQQQCDSIYQLEWLNQSNIYSDEIKKFIKENLQCQICLSLMKKVIELDCQHTLCEECFKKQRSYYKWENQCPFCKNPIQMKKKQTERAKTLENLIKTLEIQCPICSQISVEESKENYLLWQGQIQYIVEHLKSHTNENEESTKIKCSNSVFGCDMTFQNKTLMINHLGLNCQYQWRRCGFCIKILPVYLFQNHTCDPQDFFNKAKVQACFTLPLVKIESYKLNIIVNSDCDRFSEELQKIFQITKVEIQAIKLEFIIANEFIKENLLLCLKNIQFREKCSILQFEESLISKDNQIQKKQKSSKEYFLSYLSQRLNVFQRRLIQFNYTERSIFVTRINAQNGQQARKLCYENLTSSKGNIIRVDIFGKSIRGKYDGKIQYENEQAAKEILEKVNNNGCFNNNGFKCTITNFIDINKEFLN